MSSPDENVLVRMTLEDFMRVVESLAKKSEAFGKETLLAVEITDEGDGIAFALVELIPKEKVQ